MSSNGYQMGGCIGFLKTMRRIVEEVQPIQIVIVWEGGGSTKRRKLYAEYKMNRKPEKLNRFYEDDIPDSDENKKHQVIALLNMLKQLPVCQLYASDCEADDVIAYLNKYKFKDDSKVIASSDKDFYQLLDDNSKIYSLHKKIYVNANDVFEEFRVQSKHFALAKALCGDKSDNVPGVKGCGFKTVAKLFPMLGTMEDLCLNDIFNYCHSHVDESRIYKRIIESIDDVKRNWRLVYLDGTMISSEQIQRIDNQLSTFKPHINRMEFMRKLIKEGVNDFNIDTFFYTFNCVENLENR